MDVSEYRQRGKEMVDYIADYLENIRERRVFPNVKPGYMKTLLPDSAPVDGEKWESIFADVERVIMPGVTHWQSPYMHAYFPALNSFPSLLGDMLADAINCLGFTWASSPACTELEIIVMNWLGKMIGLPDDFLYLSDKSKGGGVIQTTASEATLVCLLSGRTKAIRRFHELYPGHQDAEINARLVAYCSDQAHSSVEKAALIGLVRMRYIEADEKFSMRGKQLRQAIEDDIKQGLKPFWVCATLGTTGSCAFDNLEEIGLVCCEFNLWLHVDAAYAGSAFLCPEYRAWLKGIEYAHSIAFNPSKWLMVHFDATALWVKDSTSVHRTFNVEPLYLQHENSGVSVDFMHWQIPLSRRFRALKVWFVLRSFGIRGLQNHIREGVRLAQKFEALVLKDHRFEIAAERHLGLVVFRIRGDNEMTERLLKRLNHRGNIHCIPSSLKGKYVIRFTVTSTHTSTEDIIRDWDEIRGVTTTVLEEMKVKISANAKLSLKDLKEKNESFGSSLLLSNLSMSPKIVNGSFAAIFDTEEFLAKTYAGVRIAHQDSPSMRRRVRGILMSGKQFSLDSHIDVALQGIDLDTPRTDKSADSAGDSIQSREKEKVEDRAILEESTEESWEVYDALIKTPVTPPPIVSPILLTQTKTVATAISTSNKAPYYRENKFTPNQARHPSKQPPQTLTISSLHTLNKLQNISNTHVLTSCNVKSTSKIRNISESVTQSLHTQQSHHKQPTTTTTLAAASSNNNRQLPTTIVTYRNYNADTRFSMANRNVYHGKRYLDPVVYLFDNSSFSNCENLSNAEKALKFTKTFVKINELSESDDTSSSSCESDSDVVTVNPSKTSSQHCREKIKLRVSDEYGRRIPTSFDSTFTENDESDNEASGANGSDMNENDESEIIENSDNNKNKFSINQSFEPNFPKELSAREGIEICTKCGHESFVANFYSSIRESLDSLNSDESGSKSDGTLSSASSTSSSSSSPTHSTNSS